MQTQTVVRRQALCTAGATDNAWTKSFNTGADDSYIKTNALIRVRAARRF